MLEELEEGRQVGSLDMAEIDEALWWLWYRKRVLSWFCDDPCVSGMDRTERKK